MMDPFAAYMRQGQPAQTPTEVPTQFPGGGPALPGGNAGPHDPVLRLVLTHLMRQQAQEQARKQYEAGRLAAQMLRRGQMS